VFAGCSHEDGHNKSFVAFLKRVFEVTNPELALIEYDNKYVKELSERYKTVNKCNFSEKELVFYLGNKYSVDILGMDMPRSKNVGVFTGEIDGKAELAIFSWFLILIQQKYSKMLKKKHYSKIQKFDIERDLFLKEIFGNGWLSPLGKELKKTCSLKKVKLHECFDMLVFNMYNKYVKKTRRIATVKASLSDSTFLDPAKARRTNIGKKLLFWNACREAEMINTCINQLKTHDSIIAIAGNSHVIRARDHLFKELDKDFGNAQYAYLDKRLLKKLSKDSDYLFE